MHIACTQLTDPVTIPVDMQFGVDGHKFSCPPDVTPMLEGLGAAPKLKSAPKTVKLTLLSINSLHGAN